jgi:hypothetical protein
VLLGPGLGKGAIDARISGWMGVRCELGIGDDYCDLGVERIWMHRHKWVLLGHVPEM